MVTKREQEWPYLYQINRFLSQKLSKETRTFYDKTAAHQDVITTINIYTPNSRAPKYMKQTVTELK